MNPQESVSHTWEKEIICKVDCVLLKFLKCQEDV